MNFNVNKIVKLLALILSVLMFLNGCASTLSGELDFEDVTYKMEIDSGSKGSDASSDDVSSEDILSDEENISSSPSSDVTNGDGADNNEEDTKKYSSLPVLLNPNGFNINSVSDIQKFSCVDNRISVSTFLPNVAYIENGVARGVMFDGMAFIPSPNYVHSGNDEGIKPMNKEDWSHYIHNLEFRTDYNIDALNVAAGMVKEALDMPDYKVGVFLGLLKPSSYVEDWGEANGKHLNLKDNPEDRITALKWFVDESIKTFNEKNYEHLEFCGFYYYNEYVYDEDKDFLLPITDYIRSLKYITIWAPFYRARGYARWKEFGFDRACMQANYFPGTGLPNAGGIERLSSNAIITSERGMGFEMEFTGITDHGVDALKEYYKAGINYGFMKTHHTWWIMGGPNTIRQLSNSNDPYIQSTYREMYLFINEKLNMSAITLRK